MGKDSSLPYEDEEPCGILDGFASDPSEQMIFKNMGRCGESLLDPEFVELLHGVNLSLQSITANTLFHDWQDAFIGDLNFEKVRKMNSFSKICRKSLKRDKEYCYNPRLIAILDLFVGRKYLQLCADFNESKESSIVEKWRAKILWTLEHPELIAIRTANNSIVNQAHRWLVDLPLNEIVAFIRCGVLMNLLQRELVYLEKAINPSNSGSANKTFVVDLACRWLAGKLLPKGSTQDPRRIVLSIIYDCCVPQPSK